MKTSPYVSSTPNEYNIFCDLTLIGTQGTVFTIRVMKWDDSVANSVTVTSQTREVYNFAGGGDKAFFTISYELVLDKNDYVYLTIANTTDTTSCTAELGSYLSITEK